MPHRLVGTIDGRPFSATLAPGYNSLGRSNVESSIVLPGDKVSRCHARIDVTPGGIEIHDLQSHNGTYVNGVRVEHATIRAGDSIRLADIDLDLRDDAGEPPRATPPGLADARPPGRKARPAPTFRSHASLDSARITWTHLETASGDAEDDATSLLRALVDLGTFLVHDEPGRDIGTVCLEHIARLFQFRLACLIELNETSGEAEILSHYPPQREPELEVSRTMIDMVVRERRTLVVRDVASEAAIWETAYQKGIRSAMLTPLLRDDEVLGVLYIDHESPVQEFESRQERLLQLLANLVAAKVASTRTRNEIEWAAFIQNRLLPERLVHPDGYDVAARLVPSHRVGGDLYEALALRDGRYLYALGDVVGHGVGASLMMSNALATLRALARGADSPLELATQLHELMGAQLAPYGYVTLFLGCLDPGTHRLEYVTAGHPPPVLFRPGREREFLASTGGPIGMRIPVPLQSASTEFQPGTLLAIWSDGIPEAVRVGARPVQDFTEERLVARLEVLRERPLEAILAEIFRESEEFVGSHKAQDDRTMVLLRREV